MKSKSSLAVLILLVVFFVGGIWYLVSSRQTKPTETDQTATQDQAAAPQSQKITSNVMDLLKMGKDYTCSFTSKPDAVEAMSGTVYTADQGKKFRGTFATRGTDTRTETNVLRDAEYTYIWTMPGAVGYKMKFNPEDANLFPTNTKTEQPEQNAPVDQNEPYEFDCSTGVSDQSVFTLPSTIEFTDFTAQMESVKSMMNASPGTTAGSDNDQTKPDCSMCDQAPTAESKAQCRAALKC